MTTKIKIVSGFVIMVVLLGVVAVLGYRGLGSASDGFVEYRRLARLNVYSSDIVASANAAEGNIYKFLDNIDDRGPIADAQKASAVILERIKASREFIQDGTRKEYLDQIQARVEQFNRNTDIVSKNVIDAYTQYTDVVQVNARKMMDRLTELGDLGHRVGNIDALNIIAHSWDNLASARSSLSRYAESRDPADGKRTIENLDGLSKELETIGATLTSAEGRRLYSALMADNKALQDGMGKMAALNEGSSKALGGMIENLGNIRDISANLSVGIDKQMVDFGTLSLNNNNTAQTFMMGISAGGFIFGIVLAFLIVIGIVRVLTRVSNFALGIARGDFDQKLDVKEKGEIGDMVNAMREIPAVLEKVTVGASHMANDILSGYFRNRLDPKDFLGSYANIANAVNTVGEAYTGVLDQLPVPLMSCDTSMNIMFMNKVGQDATGGNFVGEPCAKHLRGDLCNSANCFGSRTLKEGVSCSGECVIEPKGVRMDINVTAIPLRDSSGKASGFLEIINDLTEIRTKERTMLQVAREASDISDRVAAASEELSAQVEQVSRGAEMQRDRVDSTASAMTEMNATVLEVARSAGQASEQSELTRQRAEGGSELVSQVVSSIHTVNTVAQAMQKNMSELGQQAESIGSVMSVISDIADQTNLLALNAAIEAARAGEAGRGFAVVADEVRKLAEKTMSATQEVGSNITSIQDSTRRSMADMEDAARGVIEATDLANSSGEALSEIVELASANSSVVTSIATAAEEQSATSDEINRAIDEISHVVGETTDGMVQSSAAVQELARMAQELKSVMERLK